MCDCTDCRAELDRWREMCEDMRLQLQAAERHNHDLRVRNAALEGTVSAQRRELNSMRDRHCGHGDQ